MHIKHMHNAIEKIAEDFSCDVDKGIENMNVGIAEKQAEILEKLCEAEYFARISKAMEESEKEEEEESKYLLRQMKEEYGDEEGERRFYNRNRYSNGRFAPKGRGRSMRMGYMPMPWDEEEYMQDYRQDPRLRNVHFGMGYTDGNRGMEMNGRNSYGEGGRGGDNEGSRYGRSYENYRAARKHYTENPTPENQKMMKSTADEAWDDVEEMVRKIYGGADTQDKAKMKQRLTQFAQQLPA